MNASGERSVRRRARWREHGEALTKAGAAVPFLAGVAASSLAAEAGAFAVGPVRWVVPGVVLVGLAAGLAAAFLGRRGRRQREREDEALFARLDALCASGGGGTPGTLRERVDVLASELAILREIADGVHCVEAFLDARGRFQWISPSIERLTGRSPATCRAAPDALDLLIHESDRKYFQRMAQRVFDGSAGEDFEMRLVDEEGRARWVACHLRRGRVSGLRLSAEDIQDRKETEYKLLETVAELRRAQALRERYLARGNDERQRLTALLNVIRLGILFMGRDHRVVYYNQAMLDIWGFAPDENLIGVRDLVIQNRVAALIEEAGAYFEHIENVLHCRGVSEPYELRMRDGRIISDVSAVVESAQGRRWIGRVWIYEDVTQQRRIAERMAELAERDPLTNLYNRRRFHEELERLIADAQRRGSQVGLVAIDLDGFKPINDRFGHQAGDEVLVGLARAVGGVIRRNEMFFRLGGDEFAVLMADAGEAQLCELARRVLDLIDAQRFVFDGQTVGVTASLGLATFPCHASGAEQLIGLADQAMYRSKNLGRDRWTLAEPVGESDRMRTLDADEPKS